MNKRGQLEISFGMIFSIILVIVFIAFGIYGIIKLISLQSDAIINRFLSDFQEDVNSIWKSQLYSSDNYTYNLPSNVNKLCFKDKTDNIFLYSEDSPIELKSYKINYLDLSSILNGKKEQCFDSYKSKVTFSIEKIEGNPLVIIR